MFYAKKKAFILLQAVLSLAILCLLSTTVLYFFVISSEKLSDARNLNKASLLASNSLEIIKSYGSPSDFREDAFFRDSNFYEEQNMMFFNEDWERVVTLSEKNFSLKDLFELYDIEYILYNSLYQSEDSEQVSSKASFSSRKKTTEMIVGELYSVFAKATKLELHGEDVIEKSLVEFETKKYFVSKQD